MNKTIEQLIKKSEDSNNKMPSIISIHKMLDEFKINHTFFNTTNVVEYRTAGRRYVNSRHNGKNGYILEIKLNEEERKELNTGCISLDTSDSYYSWNSYGYAQKIIQLLKFKKNI